MNSPSSPNWSMFPTPEGKNLSDFILDIADSFNFSSSSKVDEQTLTFKTYDEKQDENMNKLYVKIEGDSCVKDLAVSFLKGLAPYVCVCSPTYAKSVISIYIIFC